MHPLIQDVRFSLRLMRKRPGTTFLVIAALVLGIGFNTAIFSVVNAVLLRPLPIFQPDRVVWLRSIVKQTGAPLGTSYPDYLDWRSQSRSFEGIAAQYALSFTLTGNGPAEHVKALGISACGFKVWGVSTILGRDFTDSDDQPGANRVAILSYAFWQRKFGGSRDVLDKPLSLDDRQYSIIGVLQPSQIGSLKYADVYVTNGPLLTPQLMERDARYFFPIGRLKPHVSYAQAQAEMETITSRSAAQFPASNKDMSIRLESEEEQLTAGGRKPLLLLILASSLIFLLATVNILIVFVGNTVERGQELSVRLALGASRYRLSRQLAVHALIFTVIGSALGLLLAKLGLAFFLHHFPNALIRFQETDIDSRVLLANLGMTVLVILLAVSLPALYAFSLNPARELTGAWSSFALRKYRTLGRAALIFFEVFLASGLTLVSILLIKSLYQVEKVDLGFNPSHLVSFQINPPLTRYKEPAQLSGLYKAALQKLASLPGMQSTSAISSLPLTTQGQLNQLEVDNQSPVFGQKLLVEYESILPGFFNTMRLPLLEGRAFTDADHNGAPSVIIVDDILAAKLWPGQSALGKRVRISGHDGKPRWWEVIGVARELKHFGPERPTRWMQAYVPQYQDPTPVLSFVINTTLPESSVKTAAEPAIREVDKDLPIENFETMDGYLDTWLSGRKLSLLLLTTLAGIGIVLGVIGIYGVVASSVVQRRREIAIRMAVGATPSSTILLITRLAAFATIAGIAVGSALVLALSRVLASFLFGVSTLDPATYLLSAAGILMLTALASFVPARRLMRFNVQEILRQ